MALCCADVLSSSGLVTGLKDHASTFILRRLPTCPNAGDARSSMADPVKL